MKIMLHICCGNCAIYPVKMLRQQKHQISGYFYNDNIHPYQEFKRRLDTARDYANQVNLPLICNEHYGLDEFLARVAADPAERCTYCYQSRLQATAAEAHRRGFDGFTTTLLYSRYQKHEDILAFGRSLAAESGLHFHYEDYRQGWQEGIRISKELGLYRQQYCGCIYSERDRYMPRKKTQNIGK